MTLSVFTPSHDPTYLDECWRSLAAQSVGDFEWIVVLNGGAQWSKPNDPRVRVVTREVGGKVGAAKAEACALAQGDILVELDHDDLLAIDALEEIARAFERHPEAGLVYSNCAQINDDGSRNEDVFPGDLSWTFHDEMVGAGGEIHHVMVCDSRPPIPHNVSYIWYAPNHVRAFRRSVYEAVGGYDPTLEVCDDADLMCRLYQAAPFAHIERCLYLQRIGPHNTQRDPELNARIQIETVRIYDEHVQPNALAWARREGLAAVDLGGAHNAPEGYEPVDMALGHGDIFDWLARTKDDSLGVIRAVDFLEHVADQVGLMNELYRVLAPGGMLLTLTPSTDGRGAWCDPTHVSFWNELSFRYYCDPAFAKYVPAISTMFLQSRLVTYFPSDWHRENQCPYVCWNGTKELGDHNRPHPRSFE